MPPRTRTPGCGGSRGELVAEQGEGGRRHHRGGNALRRARQHQLEGVGRERSAGRGGAERGQADQEQPAVPERIREPTGQQQQPAESQRVGGHDPGEVGLTEPERLLDLHVGYQDDRDVDRQDQLCAAHDRQYRAGAAADALPCRGVAHST
jgi:hypothetical protein